MGQPLTINPTGPGKGFFIAGTVLLCTDTHWGVLGRVLEVKVRKKIVEKYLSISRPMVIQVWLYTYMYTQRGAGYNVSSIIWKPPVKSLTS